MLPVLPQQASGDSPPQRIGTSDYISDWAEKILVQGLFALLSCLGSATVRTERDETA